MSLLRAHTHRSAGCRGAANGTPSPSVRLTRVPTHHASQPLLAGWHLREEASSSRRGSQQVVHGLSSASSIARTKDWAQILKLAPHIVNAARVIVVGRGSAPLVNALQMLGVKDILISDTSSQTLAMVSTEHGMSGNLGNEPGVRTWQGDFTQLPDYMGPADAVVFAAPKFGTALTARDALTKACMMVRPGGSVAIATDVGMDWYQANFPPMREALATMVSGLPCKVHSEQEGQYAYCATLQVPPGYRMRAPVVLSGKVVKGLGRGSTAMGTPTANIDPAPIAAAVDKLHRGVYFGWAQLTPPAGWPIADGKIHKVVVNIGVRPTVNAGDEGASIEAHILHNFQGGKEFYGCNLKVALVGYLRPELKFSGIDALVARIKADIAASRLQLDQGAYKDMQQLLAPAAGDNGVPAALLL